MNKQLSEEQCNIENYRSYIHTIMREYSTDNNSIDYKNSFNLARSMNQLLEEAYGILEKHSNPVLAVDIALCVIEEMTNIMRCIDDTDGVVESVIRTALKLINKISLETKNWREEVRCEIFYKILKEVGNPIYINRDEWQLNFIESCFKFSDVHEFRRVLKGRLIELIGNISDKEHNKNFKEQLLIILYKAISTYESREEIEEFLYLNISYPAFREILIKRAIEYKNYELALRLTIEGEDADAKRPSLVANWKKLRYLVYRDLGEVEAQRKLAIELVLTGDYDYYEKLKKTYDEEEWPSVYSDIKTKLSMSKIWRSSQLYIEILLAEDDKRELINHIRRNPQEIERFAFLLVGENRGEVKELYKKHILTIADEARDDKECAAVAKSLIKYKEIFGDEYEEVLNMLKSFYGARQQLIGALNNI